MNLPVLTVAQVEAELHRLDAAAGTADAATPRVLVVRAEPIWNGPSQLDHRGRAVRVVTAGSPLGVHDALASGDHELLVIVTPCGNQDLPLDARARMVGGQVRRVGTFDSLQALFRADVFDPALSTRRDLCELLVRITPPGGDHPTAPGGVLDLDLAWRVFDRWCFGGEVGTDAADVLGAFAGASASTADALRGLEPGVIEALCVRWVWTDLPVAALVGLVTGSSVGEIVPLGLAYETVVGPPSNDEIATLQRDTTIRLESAVPGGVAPTGPQRRGWAMAARRLTELATPSLAGVWMAGAEQLLAARQGAELTVVSDVLPGGFTRRLAAVGAALRDGSAEERQSALTVLRAHVLARYEPERVARVEMAIRLAARSPFPASGVGLVAVAADYLDDGRWVDRAREVLSAGDPIPELAEAYSELLATANADRARRNEDFARALVEWSRGEPLTNSLVPIEEVLSRVVGPVAELAPVLVVVMDGLSHPAGVELLDALERRRWAPVAPVGSRSEQGVVAMLPTVTEISRASLLCGTRTVGGPPVEAQGFAEHPALKAASAGGSGPRLFHKGDLIDPGGQALGAAVGEAIADPRRRVVGVVVNAVDDHLGSGDQIHVDWGPASIRPLGWVLDAAANAGRVVVLVADHGHVIERGGSPRVVVGDQGERWHTAEVAAGEVEVVGPRVLAGSGRVVLPFDETRRYNNARKRGYHGGATPQEVLAPCFVLAHGHVAPGGFEFAWLSRPHWWSEAGAGTDPAATPRAEPGPAPRRPKPRPETEPTLFSEDTTAPAPDWVARLLESPMLAESLARARRQRLDPEQLGTLLRTLGDHGGRLGRQRLAEALRIQEYRLRGLVGAARQVVNVDGYGILSEDADAVVLDLALVAQQFGVGPR